MKTKEYVLVPKEDLVSLEAARLKLHRLMTDREKDSRQIESISTSMWKLTHTKYATVNNISENHE